MKVNEYTTGAEASLSRYIDNKFKEKDGLKSKRQDREACLSPCQKIFSHTHTISVKE